MGAFLGSRRTLPDRVRSSGHRLSELLGEDVVPVWERSSIRIREHWFAKTPNHIAYIAHDRTTNERLLLEAGRIRWAQSVGIPTPPLVHATEDWLVYRRVPADPLRGTSCVRALCDISDKIECPARPPPGPLVAYQGWRPSRRTLALRYMRLFAKGADVGEYVRVTRAVRSLAKNTLSHGAFHHVHVIYDAAAAVVHVIDWESLSYYPRFTDLFNIWPSLEDPDDRSLLLEHVMRRSPDLESTALLHLQGALRLRNRTLLLGGDTEALDALLAEVKQRAVTWRG